MTAESASLILLDFHILTFYFNQMNQVDITGCLRRYLRFHFEANRGGNNNVVTVSVNGCIVYSKVSYIAGQQAQYMDDIIAELSNIQISINTNISNNGANAFAVNVTDEVTIWFAIMNEGNFFV